MKFALIKKQPTFPQPPFYPQIPSSSTPYLLPVKAGENRYLYMLLFYQEKKKPARPTSLKFTQLSDTLIYVEAKRMNYQNVTLSIPKEVLRRAKHLAIERGTSLSGLLTQLLVDLTSREEEYLRAREHHLTMLDRFNMATGGCITGGREELHAR